MAKRRSEKIKNKKTKTKHYISGVTWFAILLAGVLTFLCALFFISVWSINSYYVSEAKKGKYHPEIEKILTVFSIPDEYVIWYNLGNAYYEKGNYEKAEEAYLRALKCGIPYEKECPVRVNLALAMMAQLSDEEWEAFLECSSPQEINALSRKVEKTLLDARDVLTEDGCAGKEDEKGHDKDAQRLKEEIDELLESSGLSSDEGTEDEDEEQPGEEPEDEESDDEGEQEGEPEDEPPNEEEIIDYIQGLMDDNQGERTESQEFYENYYGIGQDPEDFTEGEQGEVW